MAEKHFLQTGDVIELKPGHCVLARAPERSKMRHHVTEASFVDKVVTIDHELSHLIGRYVVYRAVVLTGKNGKQGGYRVYCEKLDDGHRVDFYQTGDFDNLIENITPVGRAKLRWVEVDS